MAFSGHPSTCGCLKDFKNKLQQNRTSQPLAASVLVINWFIVGAIEFALCVYVAGFDLITYMFAYCVFMFVYVCVCVCICVCVCTCMYVCACHLCEWVKHAPTYISMRICTVHLCTCRMSLLTILLNFPLSLAKILLSKFFSEIPLNL